MQKIIYTLQAVEGAEFPSPSVRARVAKETLIAIVEECLIKPGYATSYSLTNSGEFPFPFKKPNIMSLNGFFGPNPDYNLIAREIEELFEQPRKELSEAEVSLEAELQIATSKQLLVMVEKYKDRREGSKQEYEEALHDFDEIWVDLGKLGDDIRVVGTSSPRGKLLRVLNVLESCDIRYLIQEIRSAQRMLDEGKRPDLVKRIKELSSSWRRQNLAKFFHSCGDAKFYGAGSWIARIIAVEGEVEVRPRHMLDNPHKTAEMVLRSMEMPCQVIEL